jgi:hypothetical protein
MGIGPFRHGSRGRRGCRSCETADPWEQLAETVSPPNPNPKNWVLLQKAQRKGGYVLKVR